jgi:hypothetical protein
VIGKGALRVYQGGEIIRSQTSAQLLFAGGENHPVG